jgi:hypothetical protein
MQSLLLTSSEKALFSALQESVREGWVVEDAGTIPADDPARRMMRLHLMRFHSPSLASFQAAVRADASPESLAAHIAATDLSMVSHEDFTEMFFALGPEVLSFVIAGLLQHVARDQDLELIAGLTVIRDAQISSKQS